MTSPTTSRPPHPGARPITDPGALGRVRRLDRCATPDGFLAVAALDHPASLLAGPDGRRPDRSAAAQLKLRLVSRLAAEASGLLLDPELSLGQATVTGALPGSVGMIANIEQMRETDTGFERTVDLRPGWTPERIARTGADGAKFVFFHRVEQQEAVAAEERRVRELVESCHAHGLPCIIEPLWYPLEGEDPADPAVAAARAEAIVREAARFAGLGADVLKVQFPGSVHDAAARAAGAAAVRELDAALDVPWVLLSEAVGYDDFAVQVEIAATAGASGFMVGRAVWADAVATGASDEATERAGRRLAELVAIQRANGRPWRERVEPSAVDAALDPDWWAGGA